MYRPLAEVSTAVHGTEQERMGVLCSIDIAGFICAKFRIKLKVFWRVKGKRGQVGTQERFPFPVLS